MKLHLSLYKIFTVVCLFQKLFVAKAGDSTVSWPVNGECNSDYHFDVLSLSCSTSPCLRDNHLQVSNDGLSCSCIHAYIQSQSTEKNDAFTCTACPINSTALDSNICAPCFGHYSEASINNTSTYDIDKRTCSCSNPMATEQPTGQMVFTKRLVPIYHHDDDGMVTVLRHECHLCPPGLAVITDEVIQTRTSRYFYSTAGIMLQANPYICASCPDPLMYFDTDYSCQCPSGYIQTGLSTDSIIPGEYQKCIAEDTLSSARKDYNSVQMTGITITDSMIYEHYFLNAAATCEYGPQYEASTKIACQTLVNLCTLQLYQMNTAACAQYLLLSKSHGDILPILYISDESVIEKNQQMTLSQEIQIRFARYSLNGTFLDVLDGMQHIWTCPTSLEHNDNLQFGHPHHLAYTCRLSLEKEDEILFYEAYLVLPNVEGTCDEIPAKSYECWHRIPIHVHTNEGVHSVTRFSKLDLFSSLTTSDIDINSAIDRPVRYLKKVELILSSNDSYIEGIQFHLTHADTILSSASGENKDSAISVRCTYDVKYRPSSGDYDLIRTILFSIIAAVCGVAWVTMTRVLYGTMYPSDIPFTSTASIVQLLFRSTLIAGQVFVFGFAPLMFLLGTYWLTCYKLQDQNASPVLLLHDNYDSFDDMICYVLFAVHTVCVFHLIHKQCHSEVYFLDWELDRSHSRSNDDFKGTSNINHESQRHTSWHSILLANEWRKLETYRKTSLECTLLIIATFLIGLDYASLASDVPNFHVQSMSISTYEINTPTLLRCTHNAWYFMLISAGQILIRKLWERCIYTCFRSMCLCPQRILDLCTLSNVSILILDEAYHGFYLEGSAIDYMYVSSPHHLQLSAKSSSDNCTAFELYATPAFRQKLTEQMGGSNFRVMETTSSNHTKPRSVEHRTNKLHRFLRRFFHQTKSKHHRSSHQALQIIRASQPLTLFERLFLTSTATTIAMNTDDLKSNTLSSSSINIMYPNMPKCYQDYAFASNTFYGIECSLLLHDILTYNAMDLVLRDKPVISLALTYAMHRLRSIWRGIGGRSKFSQSSGVDELFLWE